MKNITFVFLLIMLSCNNRTQQNDDVPVEVLVDRNYSIWDREPFADSTWYNLIVEAWEKRDTVALRPFFESWYQHTLKTDCTSDMFVFFCSQSHAQELIHDKLTSANKEQVQQTQRMIDEINAMTLVRDTLFGVVVYSDRVLYFDKQGRLRKYFDKQTLESEGGQTTAYYDKDGDIIFFEYDIYSNCENSKGHYFVHKGRVMDGQYHYKCDCCDNEDEIQRHLTDTLFVETVDELNKGFVRTDSLLNLLSFGKIEANHLLLPATIPIQKEDLYYVNFDSITTPLIIHDSIDNPKSYIFQYLPSGREIIAVKNGDKYAVSFIFPTISGTLYEYSIERLNIDGTGSDELIICSRTKVDQSFPGQISYMVVWDLDSMNCLLYIQNKYVSPYVNNEFVVELDKGRLSIQKVKNGIFGLTYKYKLTKSGFVLDRVE